MPPKKAKTATGHVKCDPIPEGTIFKGTNKKEVIVGKEFAQGGFGRICDAKLVGKSEKLIIKLEPSGNGPLFTEMHVFQRIFRADMLEAYKKKHKLTHLGLPYLVESGMQENIRFLVMPKYSFCLDHVVKESRSPLKLENVVDILVCVSNALKYMHENDYVHADIKAANIMMNKKNGFNEVYLIDFGLAKKVGTVVEKEDKKKAHDGTALFTSTDAHRGCGFTFRGEMEILGHNALFWLTKSLPWKDIFDEDATLKMKAEQLVGIRAAKEDLLSNLSNLKKYIGDPAAASVVQMLYKASKIDINTKPDFDTVLKTLLNVNKGKKKAVESESEDTIPPPSTARRGRKPVAREEVDCSVESAPAVPPSSSRTTRKKIAVESDSEDTVAPPSTARRGRKLVNRDEDSDLEEYIKYSASSSRTTRKKIAVENDSKDTVDPLSTAPRGRKPVIQDDSDSEDTVPPLSTASRGRKPVIQDDIDEEDTVPAMKVPPSSSRTTRKKKSESDIEELNPPPTRRAKITVDKKEEEPTSLSTKPLRREKGGIQNDFGMAPIESRQISENEIIPGLKYKTPLSSRTANQKKESENDIEERDPPRRTKLPSTKKEEEPTSSRREKDDILFDSEVPPSKSQTRQISENEIIPGLKYKTPLSSKAITQKKVSENDTEELDRTLTRRPNTILTPQSSSSLKSRTRSIDHNLFSSRIPSTVYYGQDNKDAESKRRIPNRRSRSYENTPPISPEFRIQPIPQPQGCNII